ncbi:MAG: hypothetical protein PVI04_04750 [Anaerolineales bacterium]|jgi:hypothetical protein
MTQNVLQVWPEVVGIVGGAVVLLLFALAVAIRQRPSVVPGSQGHRDRSEELEHEEIAPDGYIDSFAQEIEEAGGSMPPVVKLALPGVIIWWLVYLLLNWKP